MKRKASTPGKQVLFAILTGLVALYVLILLDALACRVKFRDPHADTRLFEDLNADLLKTTSTFPPQTISAHKRNTFRIFWFGESSARGYPFMRTEALLFPNEDGPRVESSSARFLELLVRERQGHLGVEVVNLGLTGADMRTIYHLICSAVQYEPDLVVLQAGHNEFFPENINYSIATQAYTGSSALSKILHRSFLYRALARKPPPIDVAQFWFERNETPVTDRPYVDAALRHTIMENFRYYLGGISALCTEKSIRLMLLTAIANEEWPPDRSFVEKTDSPRETGDVSASVTTLIDLVRQGKFVEARQHLAPLEASHPEIAELYYQQGLIDKKQGRSREARDHFARSVDLATRMLRAPTQINEAIRAIARAQRHALVDVEEAYRGRPDTVSPYDIIIDNLHPSLYGQYLIAQQVYNALCGELPALPPIPTDRLGDREEFTRLTTEMGIPDRLIAQGYYFSARLHYIFSMHRAYDPEYFLARAMEFAVKAHKLDEAYFGPLFFLALLHYEHDEVEQGAMYLEQAENLSRPQLRRTVDQLSSYAQVSGFDLAPRTLRALRRDTRSTY